MDPMDKPWGDERVGIKEIISSQKTLKKSLDYFVSCAILPPRSLPD
jgi:hypothetical protein